MTYTPLALSPGAVMSKGQFISYAMKVRLNDGNDHVFYLGFDRIVELARAFNIKIPQMIADGTYSLSASSKETLATEADYKKLNVHLTKNELEYPEPKNIIHQLNVLIGDEFLLLSILRNDQSTIDIQIPNPAIEIFCGYMMNTLVYAGGKTLSEKVIAEAAKTPHN